MKFFTFDANTIRGRIPTYDTSLITFSKLFRKAEYCLEWQHGLSRSMTQTESVVEKTTYDRSIKMSVVIQS